MKVQVGIGSLGELDYYLERGADEFYCGLYSVPNHVEGARNFSAPAEVLAAKDAAHSGGAKLFFAANEVHKGLLAATGAVIEEMVGGGIDGVIIKDLALLDLLRRKKVRTEYILSTLACCMNQETLAFYGEYGVRRVALPEQLMPREAAHMLRGCRGMEAEVFLKHREGCVNYNGLCFLDCHGGDSVFCERRFLAEGRGYRMRRRGAAEHLSDLYDYHRFGARVLKVGRSPDKESSRLIFREAIQLAELLERGLFKKEFLARALEVKEGFDGLYGYLRGRL